MSLRSTALALISPGADKGLFAQLRKFFQPGADSTQNQICCSGSLDAVVTTGGMRTSLALDF